MHAAEKSKEPVKKTAFIEFVVTHSEKEHRLRTYPGEFPDLRSLITEALNLEWFGECEGMGRCATCLVEVRADGNCSPNCNPDVMMSCQTPVNDDLANTVIQL